MRGKKRSREAPVEVAQEAYRPEPQPRWLEIDEQLQRLARGIFEVFLDFAQTVGHAYKEKVWEHFGFQDPERYFIERIGIKPRTFRRYVRVQDMLGLLPLDERQVAMEKAARIGPHKAEIIAAAVEREPARFDDWVKEAEQQTEKALQERVNQKLGLPVRGGLTDGGEPGERFMRFIMNAIPTDERDVVKKVFLGIQREAEVRNSVAAFLWLVRLGAQELEAQGYSLE